MTSSQTVFLIRHHHDAVELNDTAADFLSANGLNVEHRFPFDGDLLDVTSPTPSIILGGAQNVTELDQHSYLNNELEWISSCISCDVPLLGICLGAQLIAHALGARINARGNGACEFGFYPVTPTRTATTWLPTTQYFMQAHFQEFTLPDGATCLATGDQFPHQAFRYGNKTYAVQFHPEVTRPIYEKWQRDEWSVEMSASPGAQHQSQRDALMNLHIDLQVKWFEQFLCDLFLKNAGAADRDSL